MQRVVSGSLGWTMILSIWSINVLPVKNASMRLLLHRYTMGISRWSMEANSLWTMLAPSDVKGFRWLSVPFRYRLSCHHETYDINSDHLEVERYILRSMGFQTCYCLIMRQTSHQKSLQSSWGQMAQFTICSSARKATHVIVGVWNARSAVNKALEYHWRQLPQVLFLSRQNFVTCLSRQNTKLCLSRQNIFIATKLLSRQT